MSPCPVVSKNLMGSFCMPLNILSRSFSSVPCVIMVMSCPNMVPVIMDTTYSAISIYRSLSMGPPACSHVSAPFTASSILAMTRCMNIAGTAPTIAVSVMHAMATGKSTG